MVDNYIADLKKFIKVEEDLEKLLESFPDGMTVANKIVRTGGEYDCGFVIRPTYIRDSEVNKTAVYLLDFTQQSIFNTRRTLPIVEILKVFEKDIDKEEIKNYCRNQALKYLKELYEIATKPKLIPK